MTQTIDSDDDQRDVMATPVNIKWFWSMLLFFMICVLMASLCSILWPEG